MLFRYLNSFFKVIMAHIYYYPTPYNFTYFWNFGFLATIFLVLQILTGVFLAMHYIPSVDLAFYSVEHIMRDLNYGWFIRYSHANGASMFFIVVYLHMARGLYYQSYSFDNLLLWFSGVLIFFLMIMTAFLGYVLPWGQMSFWAATVITNLVSAIPKIGVPIVYWLWGGFSVSAPTLVRFFSFHFLFPFIIAALVGIHFILLHEKGSTNPYYLSSNINRGYAFLYPYYIIKDFLGLFLFFILFFSFIAYAPNYLGHTDNYIEANPLVTPAHIVPEWYFLPFYAILRAFPDKLLGVIFMVLAIFIFLTLPVISKISGELSNFLVSNRYYIMCNYSAYPVFVNLFFVVFCLLGWLGSQPAEAPFVLIGLLLSLFYFLLVICLPFVFLVVNFIGGYMRFYRFVFDSTVFIVAPIWNLECLFIEYSGVDYFGEYYVFFIFFIFCVFLCFFLIYVSYFAGTFLKPVQPNVLKAYECGFDPILQSHSILFNIQFYRIALVFLIFDLEILYLFPWSSVSFYLMSLGYVYFYYCIFLFLLYLVLGVFYEYFNGIVYWSQFKRKSGRWYKDA